MPMHIHENVIIEWSYLTVKNSRKNKVGILSVTVSSCSIIYRVRDWKVFRQLMWNWSQPQHMIRPPCTATVYFLLKLVWATYLESGVLSIDFCFQTQTAAISWDEVSFCAVTVYMHRPTCIIYGAPSRWRTIKVIIRRSALHRDCRAADSERREKRPRAWIKISWRGPLTWFIIAGSANNASKTLFPDANIFLAAQFIWSGYTGTGANEFNELAHFLPVRVRDAPPAN